MTYVSLQASLIQSMYMIYNVYLQIMSCKFFSSGQPYTEGEEDLYDYGSEGEERTEVVR